MAFGFPFALFFRANDDHRFHSVKLNFATVHAALSMKRITKGIHSLVTVGI